MQFLVMGDSPIVKKLINRDLISEASACGITDFLTKSFKTSEVIAEIKANIMITEGGAS